MHDAINFHIYTSRDRVRFYNIHQWSCNKMSNFSRRDTNLFGMEFCNAYQCEYVCVCVCVCVRCNIILDGLMHCNWNMYIMVWKISAIHSTAGYMEWWFWFSHLVHPISISKIKYSLDSFERIVNNNNN